MGPEVELPEGSRDPIAPGTSASRGLGGVRVRGLVKVRGEERGKGSSGTRVKTLRDGTRKRMRK